MMQRTPRPISPSGACSRQTLPEFLPATITSPAAWRSRIDPPRGRCVAISFGPTALGKRPGSAVSVDVVHKAQTFPDMIVAASQLRRIDGFAGDRGPRGDGVGIAGRYICAPA
jgi:hypothetical protein